MKYAKAASNQIRILVVDDSTTTCELVRGYLEAMAFDKIDTCHSVQEAKFAMLLSNKNHATANYDLIILDIHLAEYSGVDLCRMIRHHRAYKDIPILMITADQSLTVLDRAYDAGATDYILKPLSKTELMVRLNRALESYAQHQQLLQLAHYDSLTSLTNRMLFEDRVNTCIVRAQREHHQFSLLFIDLNDFKQLNDTLGHAAGDQALVHLANVLRQSTRSVDTIGRLGGDEFVILAEQVSNESEVGILLERIYKVLERPLLFGNKSYSLSISIGVATYPEDGKTTASLLEVADLKMYQNKQAVNN